MTIPFSGMVTNDGTVSFTHTDGRIYTILRSHLGYADAIKLLNELGNDPDNAELRRQLFEMTQPKRIIAKSSNGRIEVDGSEVLFDGKPVENVIATRLVWMIEQGFNAEPLFKFLTNLSENPSYRAVQSLYAFMEAAKMAITNDGMILAYKTIRPDYTDVYTGTFDNSVGQQPTMPRNEVNDNPNETCSAGLHVCSISYLPQYGVRKGARVVICEIHPRDVVSVPVDYNHAKMRVCTYRVIGEVEDAKDILGESAVIKPSDMGWIESDHDDIAFEIDEWAEPKAPFDFTAFMADTKNNFEEIICSHTGVDIDIDTMRDHSLDEIDNLKALFFDLDVSIDDNGSLGDLYDAFVRRALDKR